MKKSAYGKPLLINQSDEIISLDKIDPIDELAIQDLIFNHPECLPISDIDESYNPSIPVCKELNTPVGALDILFITPNGDLTIVETKLWRNPEARRVVVAQILDYAKELSNWSYEDLQREINRKLKKKGNTLYDIVREYDDSQLLSESDFIDSVSRNLFLGRFLLLIAGDGIREGAGAITEFLSSAGHLNFAFAMIELNLYKADNLGVLVMPKTIVKTTEISKISIEIPPGLKISQSDVFESNNRHTSTILSEEKNKERLFYRKFWLELISELAFDDPGQPLPAPANAQNLYVYPGNTRKAWISAYFMKSQKRVGVYFRVQNDQDGHEIFDGLNEYLDDMKTEFGDEVIWNWEYSGDISIRYYCEDIFADENRDKLKEFFKTWLNLFVNVLRPRMKRIGF